MSMTFTLDEDQEGIRESAHEFARDVIRPAAPHHDATGEYPWEVLTQAFDAGLMNLHIPEKYDGGGFSHLDSLLVAEEMAWGCSGIGTAMEANGLAQAPVLVSGDEALIKKYLAPMAEDLKDGRPIMCAYAVTEPGAGSDVRSLSTKAEKRGERDADGLDVPGGLHRQPYPSRSRTTEGIVRGTRGAAIHARELAPLKHAAK